MKPNMLLAAALSAFAATAYAQQPSSRPPPPPQVQLSNFGWFAELAGSCWRGSRPDGRSDEQCYTTQYGKFVRGTIRFYQGDRLAGEGDSVFSYDPNARVIVYTQWGSTGAFGLGEASFEGRDLVFMTRLPDGEEPPTRSVWRRVSPDSYRVSRENRTEDGGWKEDLAVTYTRVNASQPAAPPPRG